MQLCRANAWRAVYRRLLRAARNKQHDVGWPVVIENLTQIGFEAQLLANWIPTDADLKRIETIQRAIGQVFDPSHRKPDVPRQALKRCSSDPNPIWALLGSIAEAYQPRRVQRANGQSAAAIAQQSSVTTERAKRARVELENLKARPPSLVRGPLVTDASHLRIYIDEAWPKNRSTGILAAVVWAGAFPKPQRLPFINTHLMRRAGRSRDRQRRIQARVIRACGALEALLGCEGCFPVVMPLLTTAKSAQKDYRRLTTHGLLLILGWLLRCRASHVQVEVFLERHSGFAAGDDETAHIQGLLEGLNLLGHERFRHVRITGVSWTDKNFEYIPYADLIAYLALSVTPHARQVAEAVQLEQWPGYLPVSLDLTPRLFQLDQSDSRMNVSDMLDVCLDIRGTRLGQIVADDLRRRLEGRRRLRLALLAEWYDRLDREPQTAARLQAYLGIIDHLLPDRTLHRSKRVQEVRARLQEARAAEQPATTGSDPSATQLVLPLAWDRGES